MTSVATRLAKRLRPDHQTDFYFHTVERDDLFRGHKPTTIPPKGMAPGTIICLANVNVKKFEGEAILIQEPISDLTAHDWENPEHHGVILEKGFLSFRCSMRANDCEEGTLYCLLKKHFNDHGLSSLGWEPIVNIAGKVTKLIIVTSK